MKDVAEVLREASIVEAVEITSCVCPHEVDRTSRQILPAKNDVSVKDQLPKIRFKVVCCEVVLKSSIVINQCQWINESSELAIANSGKECLSKNLQRKSRAKCDCSTKQRTF